MKPIRLFLLCGLAALSVLAQAAPAGDVNWPREMDANSLHLVIYQPQVDRWQDSKIESRCAVIVTRASDPTQVFGTVSIHARTEVDKDTRLVSCYWGGGWFWFPAHHYWWYHPTPFTHRIFAEHWNPQWSPGNREWIHGNVNAYSYWTRNAVVARNIAPAGPSGRGPAARPDLYAGHNGQVYQRRADGWYQQNGSGNWEKLPPNARLDQQRDSRSLGQTRQREFENRGQSPGIPRTVAPPRMSPPRMSIPSRPMGAGRGRER